LVTDFVTVAYLTDVYVLPEYQGKGLGKWLLSCINETMETWPSLRGLVVITAPKEEDFYAKLLGAGVLNSVRGHEVSVLVKNGAGR
jgi:GNAT superfamily N-acetyltransferase